MSRRRPTDNKKTFQTLALVTQLGLTMVVAIGMTSALGIWLDKRFGTSWITVVRCVLGTAAGLQSVWRMIKKLYSEEEHEKEREPSGEDHGGIKKYR